MLILELTSLTSRHGRVIDFASSVRMAINGSVKSNYRWSNCSTRPSVRPQVWSLPTASREKVNQPSEIPLKIPKGIGIGKELVLSCCHLHIVVLSFSCRLVVVILSLLYYRDEFISKVQQFTTFLVAMKRHYNSLCLSVCLSVDRIRFRVFELFGVFGATVSCIRKMKKKSLEKKRSIFKLSPHASL